MEFTIVAPFIVSIAEKYSVVFNYLGRRFDALKAFLPELGKIEAQERKWRDAKMLNEYERSRDAFVNTLVRTEKTHSWTLIPGYEEASGKLTALFDKHGRDIATDRNTAETQRIYNLVEDIERTPGMLDVLATFALIPAYNAMKEANTRFDELWQQRNRELSEGEHVDSKAIRSDCIKAIHAFYEGVEYWASENNDAQWTQLIAELSQLGSYYDRQIKARETRRKNKDNSEDEPLIAPQES
jgi:Txe/YoeB family toxin of Txe-Axe toxin-antitoxin module